jgi:ankyrin repeat protein
MQNQEQQNEELLRAAKDGDLPSVRNLLRSGANVNTKDKTDTTPLHWACFWDHEEVVIELVDDWNADIEAKDDHGCTPLHSACCSRDNLDLVVFLLDMKADIHTRCHIKRTPLHRACCYGFAGIVQVFISAGADIHAKDFEGRTPLHWASSDLECAKALVSAGADIRAVNNDGNLPMDAAISEDESDVAKYLLLKFYASISDHEGRLPIHAILEDAYDTDDGTSLRKALEQDVFGTHGVLGIITFLFFQNPESRSARNQDGELPLHVACATSTPVMIVGFLVTFAPGSLFLPRTADGAYPLHVALERGASSDSNVIKMLLERQDAVIIMLRNIANETALHVACRCGSSFVIVQSLVDHYKASVQAVTPQGDLPLFLACATVKPSLDVIYLLLKLYPDVVYP